MQMKEPYHQIAFTKTTDQLTAAMSSARSLGVNSFIGIESNDIPPSRYFCDSNDNYMYCIDDNVGAGDSLLMRSVLLTRGVSEVAEFMSR